jgi:hypothetical protein
VVVTDPDGNANEVQLRKVRRQAPVDRGDFWDFGGRAADSGASPEGGPAGRRAARRGGGGGGGAGGGMFDWLFHR